MGNGKIGTIEPGQRLRPVHGPNRFATFLFHHDKVKLTGLETFLQVTAEPARHLKFRVRMCAHETRQRRRNQP